MLVYDVFKKSFPIIVLIVCAGEDIAHLPRRIHKFLIEQFKISILSLPKRYGLWFVLADFLCHLTVDQIVVTYLGLHTLQFLNSSGCL